MGITFKCNLTPVPNFDVITSWTGHQMKFCSCPVIYTKTKTVIYIHIDKYSNIHIDKHSNIHIEKYSNIYIDKYSNLICKI